MRHRKPFRQLWAVFLAITIPSVILLLFLHISVIDSMEQKNASIISSNENMIVASVEQTISEVLDSVNSCMASMDYLTFSNSSMPSRVTRYASNMTGKLRSALSDYDEVIGFALYNSACDRQYYTDFRAESISVFSHLDLFDTPGDSRREKGLELKTFQGKHLIAMYYRQRYGMLTVLLDPEQNAYFQSYADSSDEAHALSFLRSDDDTVSWKGSIYESFSQLPLRLVMDNSGSTTLSWSSPQQILILFLILLIIFAILVVGQLMHYQLIAPLGLLWDSFERISQGESSYRIKEKTPMPEIKDFYRGFNQMLDTLEEVRSQRDQSELDTAHAQLQYFQLQIRPHFYLNCLKNIKAMASIHEDDKIQDMVILMSDYLRYIFQDNRSFLPLHEELEAVQGYVDLCRIMGSPIELSFDVDSDGLGEPVLPLSILTFVENSVKHNKCVEKLSIRIAAKIVLGEDGSPCQRITIQDNGSGFSEDTMRELNAANPSELRYRKNHIGIANVRYRLWLVYSNRAKVSFRNEDKNAVVLVQFPIRPDTERKETEK